MQSHPRLVVLDRDGTLNLDDKAIIAGPDDWVPVAGALEAVARLNQAGCRVVIATNQSGLGRGLFDADTMNRVHAKMNKLLAAVGARVDAVFFCPHSRDDACDCRKPKPGMFKRIADTFNVDLKCVPAIGDSLRDLQACAALGCQPMLVLTGKGEKTKAEGNLPENTLEFANLAAAIEHLLGKDKK